MDSSLELTHMEMKTACQMAINESNPENLEVTQHKIKNFYEKINGFMGRHQLVEITVIQKTKTGSKIEHEMRFFLKTNPNDLVSREEYFNETGIFNKEVYFFESVFPLMRNIPSMSFAPDCYVVKENFLLFDDLTQQGYRLADQYPEKVLDSDHINSALKSLASLHSSSLVYEVKNGTSLPYLKENSFPDDMNNVRSKVFQIGCNACLELVRIIYQNSEKLNEILLEFPKKMKLIFQLCKTSTVFRNCVSHGDPWTNNIMFKYANDRVIDSKLVDFQFARYTVPLVDVIELITISTTKKYRKIFFNNHIENYWKYMEEFLLKHNIVLENVISKVEQEKTLEAFKIVGIIFSIWVSHEVLLPADITSIVTSNSNEFEQFYLKDRKNLCLNAFNNDKIYRERLTDMITDFVDNFF